MMSLTITRLVALLSLVPDLAVFFLVPISQCFARQRQNIRAMKLGALVLLLWPFTTALACIGLFSNTITGVVGAILQVGLMALLVVTLWSSFTRRQHLPT